MTNIDAKGMINKMSDKFVYALKERIGNPALFTGRHPGPAEKRQNSAAAASLQYHKKCVRKKSDREPAFYFS